jgi:hypothetical protein
MQSWMPTPSQGGVSRQQAAVIGESEMLISAEETSAFDREKASRRENRKRSGRFQF